MIGQIRKGDRLVWVQRGDTVVEVIDTSKTKVKVKIVFSNNDTDRLDVGREFWKKRAEANLYCIRVGKHGHLSAQAAALLSYQDGGEIRLGVEQLIKDGFLVLRLTPEGRALAFAAREMLKA